MSTSLAIFVKTPGLTPLKTRLAKTIGQEEAEAFYVRSLSALKETISATPAIAPYFAVAEHDGLSHPLWRPFQTFQSSGANLGEVLHNAYTRLRERYDNVLFVGSDSPQITTDILEKSLEALQSHDFVFGPAVDGGFYLFAGKTDIPKETWCAVAYSRDTTLQDLCEKLRPLGTISVLKEKLTDVDEEVHLQDIRAEMPPTHTASQRVLLSWMDELNAGSRLHPTGIVERPAAFVSRDLPHQNHHSHESLEISTTDSDVMDDPRLHDSASGSE